jgi:RNA-directed DNA polymerase
MGGAKATVKSFEIRKRLVFEAWKKVRSKGGAPGVDAVSTTVFESREGDLLYKLWNRMSAGSYMPSPVRAVEIPKDHGEGVRVLGVPTVADRVAQTAAAMLLGEKLEPIFHPDSYGYRPGRNAHDALAVARRRCWAKAWVLDLDIRAFFDSVPHDLLLKAVAHHTQERWVLLYIERWLKAPMQMPDGTLVARERGTPQGSPISPLLVNAFMHVCPHREVKRCRRSFCEPCCASDGGLALRVRRAGGEPKPPWCHAGQKPGWEATTETARCQRVRYATRRRTWLNHC